MNVNRQDLIRGESELPKLAENSIHVWRVSTADFTPNNLQTLAGLLAPDENIRARKFHFERDQRRFVVCRGCLRLLAAAYTAEDAAGIRFQYGRQGKPELAANGSHELQFNVSHSGDVALLAFSMGRRLGVDVEFMRVEMDFASLAEISFSNAERAAVLARSGQRRADLFFEYWSCKEACIKADGRGLSVPVTQFSVVPSQNAEWRDIVDLGSSGLQPQMRIRLLNAGAGYAAAVAAVDAGWDAVMMDLG